MLLGGYCLMWVCERRLVNGVSAGRWGEDELRAVRLLVGHPGWMVGLAGFWVTYMVAVLRTWPIRGASLFNIGLLAFLNVPRMGAALRRSEPRVERTDWNGAAEIRSEHWGEARSSSKNGEWAADTYRTPAAQCRVVHSGGTKSF